MAPLRVYTVSCQSYDEQGGQDKTYIYTKVSQMKTLKV